MEAIRCYKTQFHNPELGGPVTYISTEGFLNNIMNRDSMMGKRIGVAYAEGFTCENIPGIRDLDSLLLPEIA